LRHALVEGSESDPMIQIDDLERCEDSEFHSVPPAPAGRIRPYGRDLIAASAVTAYADRPSTRRK
jgi:hypothetical protein